MRAVPCLCELYPGICPTTEKKARKNLSQGKKNLSQVEKNLSQSRKTSIIESSVKMTCTGEKYYMSNSLGLNRLAQTIPD